MKHSDALREIADVLDRPAPNRHAATLRSAASALDASEKALRYATQGRGCHCHEEAKEDRPCWVCECDAALSALAPRAAGTRKTGDGT